jgi:hypothetical protein
VSVTQHVREVQISGDLRSLDYKSINGSKVKGRRLAPVPTEPEGAKQSDFVGSGARL